MTRRVQAAALLLTTAGLLALATAVQMQRDRLYAEGAQSDDSLLYVQSPTVMRKAALSFDSVLADVYWIRALQHYGATTGFTRMPRSGTACCIRCST